MEGRVSPTTRLPPREPRPLFGPALRADALNDRMHVHQKRRAKRGACGDEGRNSLDTVRRLRGASHFCHSAVRLLIRALEIDGP